MKNNLKCIISDMHLDSEEAQHYSYKIAKKFIQSIQPEELIIAGDFLDFGYLSLYTKDYPLLRENKRLIKDFDMFKKELDFFQTYCKRVVLIEGNHDCRLTRFVESLPEIAEGLISIPNQLDLVRRKIEWREVDQPYYVFPDLVAVHGYRYGQVYTKDMLLDSQTNVIQGHAHKVQSFSKSYPLINKTIHCWGLGCLCQTDPQYLHGKQSGWTNSIGVIEGTEKLWNFYNIDINENGFCWYGHHYK